MSHKNDTNKFENFIYGVLEKKSRKLLIFILIFMAFVGSIMMIVNATVLVKMLPDKSANTFNIYIDTLVGSSIHQTEKVTECVASVLQKNKYVTDIETYLGEGSPLNYAGLVKGSALKKGEQYAEMVVNLTDKKTRAATSFDIVHTLRPKIQERCQPENSAATIRMIEMPAGPPMLAPLVVEVYGKDNQKIVSIAKQVASILAVTDNLVDVNIMANRKYQQYQLAVDTQKVARAGLSVSQVKKILYLGFHGMQVATKNNIDSNYEIPIYLQLSKKSQLLQEDTLESLGLKLSALKLMNKKGLMIPLTEVVHITKTESNPIIYHKDLKTMVYVTAGTDKMSQVYPLLEARKTMIDLFSSNDYIVTPKHEMSTNMFDFELQDRYSGEKYLIHWDGEMKVTLDTFRDLGTAFIAALLLIFVLFVIYYKSFAVSAMILGGSFFSIIGVIVGHWVADLVTINTFYLTATSLIGFIALMGISSRNSLLMIDFAKNLIDSGVEKRRAIAIASATRAKPIILTAIAIILGSALLTSDPVFGGLGVALISGTVVAVIVSLLFIPVLMDNTKSI